MFYSYHYFILVNLVQQVFLGAVSLVTCPHNMILLNLRLRSLLFLSATKLISNQVRGNSTLNLAVIEVKFLYVCFANA